MDFINFHIAYLLTKHECIIIPDFGAFVVSKVLDDNLKKRGFISPPISYSLSFNPEIIQDDGLLVHSIAKEKNIDYTEALRLVYEYVDSLVDNLRTGQTVQFPWIGKIHLSGDRKIVFTPAKNLSCNASNCGLANLNFPTLNESLEEKSEKKHKKIYQRPVFYAIIFAIIALVSALVFILPVSKLLDKKQSSFPNEPVISNRVKTDSIKPATDTLSLSVFATDSAKPVQIDSIKPATANSKKSSPEYFIIISSFKKEKEAEVMLNYFLTKGLEKAKIIRSDGKYRISIEKFDNKEKAIAFLDTLKKNAGNPIFKDAWIFEDKGR